MFNPRFRITHSLRILCLGATLTGSYSAQAEENSFDALSKMFKQGTADVNFRYRFEGVDQDGIPEDAQASLLKTRLTLTTGTLNGFKAQLEFDDVTRIGVDDYNSTKNGKTEYPIVADVEATDLNQAWLAYSKDTWTTKFGRQRILHGNQRFIGGVAWRQNEQTYDGWRLQFKPAKNWDIDLAYVYNINRIFGPEDGVQPSDWEGNNVFARVDYDLREAHTISAFAYLIDVEAQQGFSAGRTVNNSTSTTGLAYKGKLGWLGLEASWATQSDYGDSQLDYEADYYLAELSGKFEGITMKVGLEVLEAGEDNNTGSFVGFKTPLATLHKFQGWADKFLGTPADGIEDAYVGLSGQLGPVKVAATYHDFQAENGSQDYGSELDLVATWPVNKQLTLQAKYADYNADNLRTDTRKFWITAQLKL